MRAGRDRCSAASRRRTLRMPIITNTSPTGSCLPRSPSGFRRDPATFPAARRSSSRATGSATSCARSTIPVIHDLAGDTREQYENVLARIDREAVVRGNRWPWPDMAFHVSWWTESGWRATELRRHEIRDYEARPRHRGENDEGARGGAQDHPRPVRVPPKEALTTAYGRVARPTPTFRGSCPPAHETDQFVPNDRSRGSRAGAAAPDETACGTMTTAPARTVPARRRVRGRAPRPPTTPSLPKPTTILEWRSTRAAPQPSVATCPPSTLTHPPPIFSPTTNPLVSARPGR